MSIQAVHTFLNDTKMEKWDSWVPQEKRNWTEDLEAVN